jgi:hypothetical protein
MALRTADIHFRGGKARLSECRVERRETQKTYESQNSYSVQWKAAQRSLCRTIEVTPEGAQGSVREQTHSRRPEAIKLSREPSLSVPISAAFKPDWLQANQGSTIFWVMK